MSSGRAMSRLSLELTSGGMVSHWRIANVGHTCVALVNDDRQLADVPLTLLKNSSRVARSVRRATRRRRPKGLRSPVESECRESSDEQTTSMT